MSDELRRGESVGLGETEEGGPFIERDANVAGAFAISGHGGELYRDEIKQMAELAGFEVSDRADQRT